MLAVFSNKSFRAVFFGLILGSLVGIAVNTPICLRLLEVSWFPDNDSPWILPIFLGASTVGALAAPVIGATANAMLADIADEHELESGVRRDGVFGDSRVLQELATVVQQARCPEYKKN